MTQLDTSHFPHLHLLVSGGNSQLILLASWDDWQIIGQTLDDAAGECFDKTGRMLGLKYPAGISISRIAKMHLNNYLELPISMQKSGNYNYSFSGLKTAVRNQINKINQSQNLGLVYEKPLNPGQFQALVDAQSLADIEALEPGDLPKLEFIYKTCVSIQTAIVAQLISKVTKAIIDYQPKSLGVSGGVSASLILRQELTKLSDRYNLGDLLLPQLKYTGDNAVMIGLAGILDDMTVESPQKPTIQA